MKTPLTKNVAPAFRQKKRSKPDEQTPSPNRDVPAAGKITEREAQLIKEADKVRVRCEHLEYEIARKLELINNLRVSGMYTTIIYVDRRESMRIGA